MKKDISFVKLAGRWYALLPDFDEGDVTNLEMVAGADVLIEELYKRYSANKGLFSMEVSDGYIPNSDLVLEANGDVLEFDGDLGETYTVKESHFPFELPDMIWLCPVLKWFFNGEYPEYIYVKI